VALGSTCVEVKASRSHGRCRSGSVEVFLFPTSSPAFVVCVIDDSHFNS
jgi:hypothetical protein